MLLIGCGRSKRPSRERAADLYTGSLFVARRGYAEDREQQGCSWFIVSAQHGLIGPDVVIDSYDASMEDLAEVDAAGWALGVVQALLSELDDFAPLKLCRIEIHAGADYAEPLQRVLNAIGISAARPVEGLGIGEQLAWYAQARRTLKIGMAPSGAL